MKTKILLSIICACSFFKLQAQEAQEWEYVCSLIGEQLCQVFAQGENTVYVVGENGLIAKSTDNGLTWTKQYFSGNETLNDIIFCNDNVGFIAGNNGTILRTQDAGSSWEQMASGTVLNLNAIAAFDLNNIWAIGSTWNMVEMRHYNVITHSTDMGETWNTKSLLPDNLYLTDIKCKGNKGYIGTERGVLKTEDSGAIWEEQILTGYYDIRSFSITDNKVYALGSNNIIFTENNVDWSILDGAKNKNIGIKSAIYFQDNQKGFIASYDFTTCGDCGILLMIHKITDGGNIWEYVYENFFQNRKSSEKSNFAFSSNNEFGYALLRGFLVRTPYTGEFYDCRDYNAIDAVISDPVLILTQNGKELQINSDLKMMDKVELLAIDGRKIIQKNGQTNILNIDVSILPKGIYLINVLFSDKTNYSIKWVKNN